MHFAIEHVAIAAAHPAALRDWYMRVLGAKPVWDNGKSPLVCLIALGGAWLEIYAAETPQHGRGNNKQAGWRHVSLRVNSIEEARGELIQRGVTFHEKIIPAAGGGKVLFFEDPEGNLLHLTERPADWHPAKA